MIIILLSFYYNQHFAVPAATVISDALQVFVALEFAFSNRYNKI